MKKLVSLIILLIPVFLCGQQRIYLSGIDHASAVDWDFMISGGANSGTWTTIPVPSNWEFFGFGNYTYGEDFSKGRAGDETGFYKRTFTLQRKAGRQYILTFQGVLTDAYVKINGQSAGPPHQGGFTQFRYNITPLLVDGENLLEVEVHKKSGNEAISAAEQQADYWVVGGIYRPVYIDILPDNHIERVAINAEMDGAFEMDVFLNKIREDTKISGVIRSQDGSPAGTLAPEKVRKKRCRLASKLTGVKTWNHETPVLYTVEVFLTHHGDTLHTYREKFGFRTFEVRDHDGFYLNGKRILLKGANLHSWHPASGRSLSRHDIETNFRLMKEMNFNAVRPCHYPPDEYLFDLCDSLGLLALDELPGWHSPLPKKEGARMVKEMVSRDVNHPSIIMWGNGNHQAHNPALDEDFFLWDIQQRRPLRNAAKKEDVFAGYDPDFDIVDTRFYPNWEQLVHRLHEGGHIVLPNEALHALYDGGGAANLKDYWEEFKHSEYGGGLMIWAFLDEGAIRWDQGNRIDVFGNMYPDGIVGPNREKEGSFYAVKEIWSPVQIDDLKIDKDFSGTIPVKNEYVFTDLNRCRFTWELVNFSKPNEAGAGYRVQYRDHYVPGSIPPGENGALQLNLPSHWKNYDALRLKAAGPAGEELYAWCWPIATRKALIKSFHTVETAEVIQDREDPYTFNAGCCQFAFDRTDGTLREVIIRDTKLPLSNFPKVVSAPGSQTGSGSRQAEVTLSEENGVYKIKSQGANGFDAFQWTLHPNGTLELDYTFTLERGAYSYAGIAMPISATAVQSKRWLGEGPYRIWKNRTQGGALNVWEVEKRVNIPGEAWNMPAFEGFFAPWYWASVYLDHDVKISMASPHSHLTLGMLNPVNGDDPKRAKWEYPSEEGIYFFHHISPVGSKWKNPAKFGPSAQQSVIAEPCSGSILFNFSWNREQTASGKEKVEIE
mgnify:CR=1 FL=1